MKKPGTPYTGSSRELTDEVLQFFRLIGPSIVAGQHVKVMRKSDGIPKAYLRLRLVYPIYKQAATERGLSSFSIQALRGLLAASIFFLEDCTSGVRFTDAPDGTSAMVFDFEKLQAASVMLSYE